MRALAQRLTTPYALRPGPGRTIGRATAALAIGAGLIHVSAAVDHGDLPPMMVGFEIVALLQVGLGAVLILGRPNRTLLAGGIALMASAVLLWVISRTAGLGFLVAGAHVEPIGFKDSVTVLFELLAIGGLGMLVHGSGQAGLKARWLTAPQLGVSSALALALFVPALLVGGHHHAVTHVASVHGPDTGPHLRVGHLSGTWGRSGHRRGHGDRGTDHTRPHRRSHETHPETSAPAHSHEPALAVAHTHGAAEAIVPTHDHALTGIEPVAGAGHGHADGGATSGGGHPAGSPGHGTHPPGHDSDYGDSPEQPPPPTHESPASGLEDEVDKLIP